jgi:hypothetical protein
MLGLSRPPSGGFAKAGGLQAAEGTPRRLRRAQNPYFALWRGRSGQSRAF